MSLEPQRPNICRFFATGQTCRFGNNCRFLHSSSSDIEPPGPATKEQNDALVSSYSTRTKVCRSYTETRFCRFGVRCRYFHPPLRQVYHHNSTLQENDNSLKKASEEQPYYSFPLPQRNLINDQDDEISTASQQDGNCRRERNDHSVKSEVGRSAHMRSAVPRRRICRYFESGNCYKGKRCPFLHPDKLMSNISDEHKSDSLVRDVKGPVVNPLQVAIKDITKDEGKILKNKEVKQLKVRYQNAMPVSHDDGSVSCVITFSPTDPDWPYDLTSIDFTVFFGADYPLEPMVVTVNDGQNLPGNLSSFVDEGSEQWINTRFEALKNDGKAELMFRPWLRWLDRSLEDIFTNGLRQYKRQLVAEAAGLKFISAEQLQKQYADQAVDSEASEETATESEESDDESTDEEESDDDLAPQPGNVGEMPPSSDSSHAKDHSTYRRGTEMKLRELQLSENACTLMPQRVKVVISCGRCRTKDELTISSQKPMSRTCMKCSELMIVAFRPCMAHQFSSIIGYMDVQNCHAFDVILMDCFFTVGCFNCNKDVKMQGLQPGTPSEMFCLHCHKKMKVMTQSVRLQALQASEEIDISELKVTDKKSKRKPKDPSIQEGKPLPYEGTCKHYHKSYRWFRFPCCGKAYPCDVCHEEGEGGGHEMIFANRMICGFCCKEQTYSGDRPCVSCGYSLIKTYSSHWEGGKGCRDKIKMARDDKKKYSNMNKCLSKKSVAKQQTGNKSQKTTKLRHS